MSDAMRAETVRINGAGGDEIEAYLAQPLEQPGCGAMVVIHHMPGYDESTKEITRKLAAHGYLALCPNLYSREAPGASPDDAAAAARAQGGVSDDQVVGDVDGAARFLRALPASNGKVGVIGYCSGGRQTFLVACRLPFDAAIDCYGGFVLATPPAGAPVSMHPLGDLAEHLSCPLLGLFGAEDANPSPAETAELAEILARFDKTVDFHTFENAGHGFFSPDRPNYRIDAAVEGWRLIWDFLGQQLA